MKSSNSRIFLFVMLSSFLISCGGGGGSSGTPINVSGSIHDDPATARRIDRAAIPGIKVCAFAGCSTTDVNGDWAFTAEVVGFTGGAVLFTFTGNGLDTKTVVPDISSDTTDLVVDFFIGEQSRVEIENIEQSSSSSSSSTSSSSSQSSSSSSSSPGSSSSSSSSSASSSSQSSSDDDNGSSSSSSSASSSSSNSSEEDDDNSSSSSSSSSSQSSSGSSHSSSSNSSNSSSGNSN